MNRTKVDLLRYINIDELRAELSHVATLSFTPSEIDTLLGWRMFRSHFKKELEQLTLVAPTVSVKDGRLVIESEGLWWQVTLWEIYVLAIVAELYGRGRAKADGITEQQLYDAGMERLLEKVTFFNQRSYLRASQFGLRRRFSALWEETMTRVFLEQTKLFTGVSNVRLAIELGVEAQGTNAHELPMAAYANARGKSNFDARQSIYQVLHDWQMLYGQMALIMLPDAYGTDAFLERLPDDYLYDWRGFRQDSGDAVAFGEKVITKYNQYGIDPREKLIIFSDGLTPVRMEELYQHFAGRINVAFGVGTNLSNDMGLIDALSLVMKLTEADGRPTVKLSDNIAKATGDRAEIDIAKRIFGYTATFREEAVY
jgi:nicotinate phosphoribosyltransferase